MGHITVQYIVQPFLSDAQVAFFGPGGGAVVYGYVVCHGYEASLFDCFLALFPLCLHNGDVGVRCSTHGNTIF